MEVKDLVYVCLVLVSFVIYLLHGYRKLETEKEKSEEKLKREIEKEQLNNKALRQSIQPLVTDKKILLDQFEKEKEFIKKQCQNEMKEKAKRFFAVIKKLWHYKSVLYKRAEIYKAINTEDYIDQDTNYNKILTLLNDKKNVFITGGAGVGKSYIVGKLKQQYGDKLKLTAMTGVAAVNVKGSTIHSFLKMGCVEYSAENVISSILNNEQNKLVKKEILETELLCIDEISMCNQVVFEYIDEVLKGVRKNNLPFGGVQVILVGDFLQLPPVNKKEDCKYKAVCEICNCKDIKERINCSKRGYCFNSELFKEFEMVNLTEVKRQERDKLFTAVLNKIRFGRSLKGSGKIFETKNIKITQNEANKSDVIHLYPTNKECDTRNRTKYESLKGASKEYRASYDFETAKESEIEPTRKEIKEEFKDALAKEILELKVNCRVMLVFNVQVQQGLCNGATGTVKELNKDSVIVKFDNGNTAEIKRVIFEIKTADGIYKMEQIPLVLAYAITIHKSQGMTLKKAMISLNCFTDGQAYVALSRLESLEGLRIIGDYNSSKIVANTEAIKFYIENGVYE